MPFKTFAIGEEALAADTNTYLMKQAVATFPTAAARAAAITAPIKGQLTARDDQTGLVEMWDGGAWVLTVPLPSLFTRSPGLTVAANASVLYSLAIPAAPMAGRVLLDAILRIDTSTGTTGQSITATFDATSSPVPGATYGGAGTMNSGFQSVQIRLMGYWSGIARGQAITAVVKVANATGQSIAVTFAKLEGVVWWAPLMSSF